MSIRLQVPEKKIVLCCEFNTTKYAMKEAIARSKTVKHDETDRRQAESPAFTARLAAVFPSSAAGQRLILFFAIGVYQVMLSARLTRSDESSGRFGNPWTPGQPGRLFRPPQSLPLSQCRPSGPPPSICKDRCRGNLANGGKWRKKERKQRNGKKKARFY
ncbi:unnamed protein product [Linum trigynum]|uniref:Uncharacterized protein n=1 Tax=Linum trigynum TaxID=586398 RepID=A0AAV2FA30_9ROSI